MAIRLTPYVFMNGNAREAISFYEQALQAEVVGVVPFSKMPADPDHPLPEEAQDLVAHALLKVGESDLMLCDHFPGQPHETGGQVAILISANDTKTAKQLFDALQQGGHVDMPFQETFWSPGYGMVTDKFGVSFQITTESQE